MAIGYIQRLGLAINISESEWGRVSLSWLLIFFYKISLIIGWTILIALFVTKFGIAKLPILFLIHAILTILGSSIFTKLVQLTDKHNLVLGTALISSFLLYIAILISSGHPILFFILIILVESLFLSQLGIIITIYNESLYSPLEGERTFPFIESGETIGILAAGIILNQLAFKFQTHQLIYIWILSVISIIPILLSYLRYIKKLPPLEELYEHVNSKKNHTISNIIEFIFKSSFLKSLLLIIILQWMFLNIFEYQYTKSIHEYIQTQTQNKANIESNHGNNYGIEQTMVYDLGSLQIIFSSVTFLVQIFIASRVIFNLGIINSMMLNPLIMLLTITGMTLKFNLISAVIAKASYEMSNTMFKTPYHSIFYALNESYKKPLKEFMEGIAKPIGAIIGASLIPIFQMIYIDNNLHYILNSILLVTAFIILVKLFYSQRSYTRLVCDTLENEESSPHAKFEALEILSQKGHKNSSSYISSYLMKPSTSKDLKIKALQALSIVQDHNQLPEIIECLRDEDSDIRFTGLECLGSFEKLDLFTHENAFSLYRIISTLKNNFSVEKNEENLCLIIKLLAQFNNTETIAFIIENLEKNPSIAIKKSCIQACAQFKDPNCAYYLKPYLVSELEELKIAAICSLWNFSKYRGMVKKYADEVYKNHKNKKLFIEMIASLKMRKESARLKSFLNSKSKDIRLSATIALTQLNDIQAATRLAKYLLESDQNTEKIILHSLKQMAKDQRKEFEHILKYAISNFINKIHRNNKQNSLKDISLNDMYKLKRAYYLASAEEEYFQIHHLIQQKEANI